MNISLFQLVTQYMLLGVWTIDYFSLSFTIYYLCRTSALGLALFSESGCPLTLSSVGYSSWRWLAIAGQCWGQAEWSAGGSSAPPPPPHHNYLWQVFPPGQWGGCVGAPLSSLQVITCPLSSPPPQTPPPSLHHWNHMSLVLALLRFM